MITPPYLASSAKLDLLVRLPFPERILLSASILFAIGLVIVQQLQGTDIFFSAGCFVYILIATIAFNTAGGFTRPSGAYIFFNATLTLLVGVVFKAYLGEPGQTNLLAAHETIEIYVVGMAGMLLAAFLSRQFSSRDGLLRETLPDQKMQSAVYGCILVGVSLSIINHVVSQGEGTALSAINQINRFLPMGILLGVTHQVRKSGGRSSLNLPVIFAGAWVFIDGGLLGYSKEGMFTPFACWLIAAASVRYRFSFYQIGGSLLAGIFLFQYLVPYAQYGRNFRDVDTTLFQQFDRSVYLLSHLDETRMLGTEDDQLFDSDIASIDYYDRPHGLWSRLQMVSIDDRLIAYTEDDHVFGFKPLLFYTYNLVPHFIWKDKPGFASGNIYAHEIGMLAEDDNSTGISFSPTSEAWHMGRWTGILLIAPVCWFILFASFDSLAGNVRKAPWGLLPMVSFAHVAPEGGVDGIFYMFTYGLLAVIVAVFFSAYVMPLLGTLISGPGRTLFRRPRPVRSIPRRVGTTPVA